MKFTLKVLLLSILVASAVHAADLYRIRVTSPAAADHFNRLDLQPISRLLDGYLILADAPAAAALTDEHGAELIAKNISVSELAFDLRGDRKNAIQYPLLFEDGAVRLYRVPANLLASSRVQLDLAPATVLRVAISYTETRPINRKAIAAGVDLDSLIALVRQDSLQAYVNRLQAFGQRVTGTDSNFAAQVWTRAKFQSFGYDSVFYDTFTTTIYGLPKVVRNVVAVKLGTRFPNRYIVVGGHQDAVPSSPGADDNGSGTAGTLEIARVLAGIESYVSIVFIAFDAEEQGLYGSNHFADAAGTRGDSIDFMLNMDMIAHYENSNQANLYSGPDLSLTNLWTQLADSLLGISATFAGVANNSDHAGFVNNGYTATFVHEYIFSTEYHSSTDSTTYMNFSYMTKMVKASLATVYAGMLNVSAPAFEFVYAPGAPEYLFAGKDTTIGLTLVSKNNAAAVPGSGRLHCSINSSAYIETPLTELALGEYQLTLPALACGDTLRFYVTIEETSIGQVSDRSALAPYQPVTVTETAVTFADNFQTDLGWTAEVIGATAGAWQRGVPVNDPSWEYTPATDADGSGSCYLTQNIMGNSDVDNGAVRVTSPAFDLTPQGSVSYYYFLTLTNTTGNVDRLLVEMNDGQSAIWAQVALHFSDTGREWVWNKITSSQIAAAGLGLTANMKIRFTANDANTQSVVEAGIDGVTVTTFDCVSGPAYLCGDANDDELVSISDAVYLIGYIFGGGPAPVPPAAGDCDCSGAINISDAVYLINYIFSGGSVPCAACS